jgi:peptidoglycan hydrolase-like protein with peptidoglycan-binding domain
VPARSLSGQQRLARLHLQPERVQEIQQALIREGYLKGDATGQWDSSTRDAMLRYQTAHGFPATGLPEAKSLMKLGLGSHPLPPELDHGEVGAANPGPAPGDLTVTPASAPVSQAVPPS